MSGILGSRLRCVYIATPSLIESFPLPAPGHCIDPIHADGPKGIAMQLIDFMGSDLVEQCQKAWDINKNLYPGKWND